MCAIEKRYTTAGNARRATARQEEFQPVTVNSCAKNKKETSMLRHAQQFRIIFEKAS